MLVITKKLIFQMEPAGHFASYFRAVNYNSCRAILLFDVSRHGPVNNLTGLLLLLRRRN